MSLKHTKSCLLVLLGAILVSISAHLPLQVPLIQTDIPGTWQTFAVLVFAFVCGKWIAFSTCILYLLAGSFGAPVFADGSSGWEVLSGRTGGYLYGFIFAAWLTGHLSEKHKARIYASALSITHISVWAIMFAKATYIMTIGTLVILACGVIHLSLAIGLGNALQYGLYPFVLGALIKILLGALAALVLTRTLGVYKSA